MSKSPRGVADQARARLAKERAGLLPPPADLAATPVGERTLRLLFNLGNDFERRLGTRIGGERAHSLRARNDGWGGARSSSSGC